MYPPAIVSISFPSPTGPLKQPSSGSGHGPDAPESSPQVKSLDWEIQTATSLVREFERAWFNYHQAEGSKGSAQAYANYVDAVEITKLLDAAHDSLSPITKALIEFQLEMSPFLHRPHAKNKKD
ncbi:hypothetical protein EST38_g12538 [Candolleomyces aberdarensis]|uniref:Uncharacterized protein n=1 Tax=Candolleomyces aberdarensis TaxID=2316362 RepID=A0A4Q2D574_9AGAR|nr:hypothetical protein EST38_g12538 [Candolleomyces aberdarensis]